MKNKKDISPKLIFISIFVSTITSIFYFFYINIPTDSILLFLPNKLFLGEWLRKGILPLYNPYIFLGTPFGFDIGLGNLHPLNLLFILPYPLSFSLWVFATVFLFSLGFLKLFYRLSKNISWSIILFAIIFFSGQGPFIRLNNPTIWAVISHYPLLLLSLFSLKKGRIWPFILWGALLSLAGHFQMVLYGFILAFLFAVFILKISIKQLVKPSLFLLFILLPYLLLSLPIVLESTRLTLSREYTTSASLSPLHLIQLILPFIFGNIREGARWAANPVEVIASSITFLPLFILTLKIKAYKKEEIAVLALLFLFAFGVLFLPFLRNQQQVFSIIFIYALVKTAQKTNQIQKILKEILTKKLLVFLGALSLLVLVFLKLGVFEASATLALKTANRYPHPFYDLSTLQAISQLLQKSLYFWVFLFALFLLFGKKLKTALFIFILAEGFILNYYHNLFIPSKVVNKALEESVFKNITDERFRTQSIYDVYPYQGIHAYISGVLTRPPFSKEKDFFENEKNSGFPFLKKILSGGASNWNMIFKTPSIQGYQTFVPADLAEFFKKPSPDFQEKYAWIIERNPLLGGVDKGYNINYIESSRLTFSDKRWETLAVGYVISPFKLEGYKNLKFFKKAGGFFIYKTKKPAPIYSLKTKNKTIALIPSYKDPNKTVFKLKSPLKDAAELEIIEHPEGKIILADEKKIEKKRDNLQFSVIIPKGTKEITIYYSPVKHLFEALKNIL